MPKTSVPAQEVAAVKRETSKAVKLAESIEIANQEDLAAANETLSNVTAIGKDIKARKEAITKPLNEAIKSVRDLFRPLENMQQEAVAQIKKKMLTYHNEVEAERRKQQERIEARVEKGTMRMDTGMKKMEAMGTAQTAVRSDAGTTAFREVKKVEITDETKIPREYLVPDMVRIRREALAGTNIPGVEVRTEKTIANTSR